MALIERHPRLFRTLALVTALSVLTSATASGLHAVTVNVGEFLVQRQREQGLFSQLPTPPYLGKKPGKDRGRGGIWTVRALEEASRSDAAKSEESPSELFAATDDAAPSGVTPHSLAISPGSGGTYDWEGSTSSAGGSVNTGNGNKLKKLSLVNWQARGGMSVDFTLFHNSQTNYSDELGRGWTWSYDIYINNLSGNPVVHWGDGLSVPYTASGGGGGGTSGGGGFDPIIDPTASHEGSGNRWSRASSPPFTTYTAPAGVFDQLVQNSGGTWTLTKKNGTKYQFNTAGFCTAIQDRNGNQITLTLNSSNYCTAITDPSGRSISISVSSTGKFQSITDPLGRVWTFTLNGSNDLSTVTWPTLDGSTYTDGFTYNTSGRILTHTDRRGKVWSTSYNSDGSIASETDPLGHSVTYGYSSSATTVTNALGYAETHNYSSGALASIQDRSGFSESVTARNSNHLPTTIVDRRGKTWTYTYDSNGNALTQTDPLSHTTTYTYDGFGQVLTATDALSHTTTHTYDTNGNLLTTTDPLSHVRETNTYDGYGQRATTKNALNHTTTFARDTHGNVTSVTDPLSHVSTMTYDGLSRVTSVSDALSNTESVAYDAWGRPVTYTHEDNTTLIKSYNAVGQLVSQTDENGRTTTYSYDNAGRLVSQTNARGDTETYAYDNADRRTSLTNGRGKVTTYTYTNRGDLSSTTLPDGAVETWTYDGAGNTTAYTNPLSQTILYGFDNAGRSTGIDYPTGTDVSLSYDNADRQTTMVDSTGTTTWTYDNANRVTGLSTPQGNLTYTYDNADRKSTMVDSTGTTTYGYDNASRLTSIQNPHSETTTFTYDDANRKTRQTFSGGQYTDYGYDSRNRTVSVVHKKSGGTSIDSESYVYDGASNLTSKTVGGTTTTYTYDYINQLTGESRSGYVASYTYDANGNRATKTLNSVTETYTVDDADKLSTVKIGSTAIKSFGYDTAGRTTSVTTSAGTTTLSYDYENRIAGISYPGGATNAFAYNGLDARVGKTDASGTATYRRDGVDVTAPVVSDGSATYTPGISERRSGTTTYSLGDQLGTASRQTNTSGTTTATRTYDAYGLLVSSTGTHKGPFGYAGRDGYQEDADSGLKLVGHRYYDASTGRFLTRDKTKEGRNWYVYCDNNPVTHTDPTGNVAPLILAGVFLIVVAISTSTAEAPTSPDYGHHAGPDPREDLIMAGIAIARADFISAALILGSSGTENDPGTIPPVAGTVQPELPPKKIVEDRGVTVEHYYKSNDHPPAHAHVKGGGPDTKIGQGGKPIKGSPELTPLQREVIEDNKATIRRAITKIMKWAKWVKLK